MTVYGKYSDDDLIGLLKHDDISAFTTIHSRYYWVLYQHAYKRLSDRDTVKDILQEVFIYLWDQRRSIEVKGNLQAYLCTAVRNKVLNVFKHEKVKSNYITSLINFAETCQSTTDENLRNKELLALVNAEVSTLPPKMRLVFELSRDSNLSHNEIAEKLEISPLTVRKQVNNSLKILRARLAPHFLLLFFLTTGIGLGMVGSQPKQTHNVLASIKAPEGLFGGTQHTLPSFPRLEHLDLIESLKNQLS